MEIGESSEVGWSVLPEGLFVLVHGRGAPSQPDWERYVAAVHRCVELPRPRSLILTDGGTPTPAQRATMSDIVARQLPTVIVSDAVAVRFIVSTITLFNPKVTALPPRDCERAFDSLSLSATEREALPTVLQGLASALPFRASTLATAVQTASVALRRTS
jgi:hypothetical protein